MSETKFGVLASLCYMMAFVSAFAAVVFAASSQSVSIPSLRTDITPYVIAAVSLVFWGFVFHAFHTSTLRRDALLTEIRDLLALRRNAAPPTAKKS